MHLIDNDSGDDAVERAVAARGVRLVGAAFDEVDLFDMVGLGQRFDRQPAPGVR